MYLYSQVLHDLEGSDAKPGGPSRVTARQTRYGQVAKQVADKREQTQRAWNRLAYYVAPTAFRPRSRGISSCARRLVPTNGDEAFALIFRYCGEASKQGNTSPSQYFSCREGDVLVVTSLSKTEWNAVRRCAEQAAIRSPGHEDADGSAPRGRSASGKPRVGLAATAVESAAQPESSSAALHPRCPRPAPG
jgi:hypothetical protein